jgi:hypothetical protein
MKFKMFEIAKASCPSCFLLHMLRFLVFRDEVYFGASCLLARHDFRKASRTLQCENKSNYRLRKANFIYSLDKILDCRFLIVV